MTGTITKLVDNRQFGMILGENGREYFFSDSALQGVRFENLALGVRVTFDATQALRGPRAERIRLTR